MAVSTEVPFDEAKAFLLSLKLGTLHTLQGCSGGIENTNYFATTDQSTLCFDPVRALANGPVAVLFALDEAPGRTRYLQYPTPQPMPTVMWCTSYVANLRRW